ncbi:MAG: T9SS type A sorting domain-containing protein [Winogradskyella sp.]|uniref:choice-of-anchor J domain-containing protein n=1 Tax=Winogradskyella sp. TaxID=1883156 RepID=UPI0017B12B11|nr:T9SS type A sorting domain-containing protein [Winogradskyella sp.]
MKKITLLTALLCFSFGVSQTFVGTGTPVDTQGPDGGTAATCGTTNELNLTVAVTGIGVLGTTNILDQVDIDITHTWSGDVELFLIAPDGTTIVELTTDNGGGGDNFTGTQFRDDAATPVTSGTAPFSGPHQPEQPLTTFNGIDADGTWTLNFCDDAGGDVGTFNSWSITFAPAPTCPAPSGLAASNITSDQADLSWTENGSASLYNVEVVLSGDTPTGTPTDVGVGNPFTKTGLESAQSFEFYVQADCGPGDLSEWAGPFEFVTDCVVFDAPVTETFEEGGSRPLCWTDTGAEDWKYANDGGDHVGNGGTITGTTASGGYYAYADASGTEADAVLLSPMVNVSTLTTPALSFYLISDSEDSANSQLDVEVWDGAAWNNLVIYNSNTSGWELQIIDLSGLTITGPVQARFTFTEPIPGDFDDDVAIDDVSFDELPSCAQPADLMIANITTTSADFSWTETGAATTWNIELVDITGGGSATGTATASGITTNPYAITGLTANNEYHVYVQADCGGDLSDWSGPVSFSTSCEAISTFPFNEDVESTSTTLNCWSVINENGDGDTWEVYDSATYANSGSQSFRMYTDFNSGNNDDYLVSPAFVLTGNQRVKFQQRVRSASEPNDFEVLLSTTGTNPADFTTTILPSASYDNTVYQEITIDLSAYSGQVYIAFRVAPGGLDGWYLYLDDIVVEDLPSCIEPSDLIVSNTMSNTVDFSWTENGTASTWDVELVDVTGGGSFSGTPTTAATSDNPLTVSGLVELNDYELYVRAICGGDSSTWVGPISFTTPCAALSTDYVADMSVNVPDSCWDEAGSGEVVDGPMGLGASDWRQGRGFTNSDNIEVPSNTLNLWQSVDREWLISPSFDLDVLGNVGLLVQVAVTNYAFSGISSATDTDAMGSDDEVQLLMTNDNGTTWTNLTTWNAGNQPEVTGTNYVFDMTGMTGLVQFAIFGSDGTTDDSEDYDFHVGIFEVSNAVLSTIDVETPTEFTYFPNPVKNILTLNAQNSIEQVTMYNMLGQEVLRATPNSLDSDLDMSNLETGTYFVKVTIANATKTIRVIKQ